MSWVTKEILVEIRPHFLFITINMVCHCTKTGKRNSIYNFEKEEIHCHCLQTDYIENPYAIIHYCNEVHSSAR